MISGRKGSQPRFVIQQHTFLCTCVVEGIRSLLSIFTGVIQQFHLKCRVCNRWEIVSFVTFYRSKIFGCQIEKVRQGVDISFSKLIQGDTQARKFEGQCAHMMLSYGFSRSPIQTVFLIIQVFRSSREFEQIHHNCALPNFYLSHWISLIRHS